MGGATLIAIAIAAFVVLVSAQVFRDWPIAALGGGNESAAVSDGKAAGSDTAAAARVDPGAGAGSSNGRALRKGDARDGSGDGAAPVVAAVGPTAGGGAGTGTGGSRDGGGNEGSTGAPQGTHSSDSGAAATNSGGGGNGGSGSSGGGTSAGGATSPSSQIAGTVDDTVSKVDETALGGTLGDSGVTDTTEEAVNGVAGPESVVGKVVDGATETVGGMLGKP